MKGQSGNSLIGVGIIAAIASSLCCIVPLIAAVASISGIAASFSWIEPLRPYLIAITILILGLAWYLKLRPRKKNEVDCDCEDDDKPSFWQSKTFLILISVFAIVTMSFPYYSSIFYSSNTEKTTVYVIQENVREIELTIEGMTCTSCEEHVNKVLREAEGILEAQSSYDSGKAIVKFDHTKITVEKMSQILVEESGYKVIEGKEINP